MFKKDRRKASTYRFMNWLYRLDKREGKYGVEQKRQEKRKKDNSLKSFFLFCPTELSIC